MKVVFDTNLLASGIVGFRKPDSTPGQLLRAWRDGAFELAVSGHILTELVRTLSKPYFSRRISEERLEALVSTLTKRATLARVTQQVRGVATHPEDDVVLATAVSASADYLVTGDGPLQELRSYQGVQIVSPRQFVEILGEQV